MDRNAMQKRYDELAQDVRAWEDSDDEHGPEDQEMRLKQAEAVILSYRLLPEHDSFWDHVTPEEQVNQR